MQDRDTDSAAGRLRGDADKYLDQERELWEKTSASEQLSRRRQRPRMSDEEHARLMDQAEDFGAGDDVSQDEINKLI